MEREREIILNIITELDLAVEYGTSLRKCWPETKRFRVVLIEDDAISPAS